MGAYVIPGEKNDTRTLLDAAAELSENLDRELELFREKVEEQPTAFQVTKREGYA